MRIGILGAGISGLTLARELSQKHEVIIFERSDRVGGWLQTEKVGPFLFEKGPRSFRTSSCSSLLELAAELELSTIPCSPEAKQRYLWLKGRLKRLSSSLLSPQNLLAILKEWRVPPQREEETIWEFASRRFNRSIAEQLFDPLTLGIYGGDIRKLSVNCCFPLFKKWEEEYGSLTKALFKQAKKNSQPSLFSFENGVHALVQQLCEKSHAEVRLNSAVTALHFHSDAIEIVTDKGSFLVEELFSALPAQVIGKLLQPSEMAELLLQIEHLSLTVVNLGYTQKVLTKEGFGYLVPTSEKEEILGCVFDSMIFPQHGSGAQLTVMIKGVEKSDEAYLEIAQRSLSKHLGIQTPADHFLITRAPHSIPQYTLGHQARIQQLLEKCPPNFHLVGNYLSGVSVNECVSRARQSVLQRCKVHA